MKLRTVCASLAYPSVMALSIGGAQWGLAHGYAAGLWGFAVTVLNLAGIALLELGLPLRPKLGWKGDRQAWNDIGHGILLSAVGGPLGSNLAVLALAALAAVASERTSGDPGLWPAAWPFVPQLALGLGIYSFLDYWKHRAYHAFDWLWWIHALHHDAERMHVLKAGRLHLLEGTIRFGIVATPLLMLGAPAEVFLWIGLWTNFEGNLNHSNLEQRFPDWAQYVLPTVQVHHIHHARERRLQDSNFAGVTTLWDVLFGTFRHPGQHPVEAFGSEGDPMPRNFGLQLLYPLRKWLTPERGPRTAKAKAIPPAAAHP